MTFFKNLKNKIASSASTAIYKLGLVPAAPDNAHTHGFAHHAIDIPSDDVCSDFCAVIPEDISRSTLADFYDNDVDEFDGSAQRYSKRYYPHRKTLEDYYW